MYTQQHELLHILGIGTLWDFKDLIENDNTANCRYLANSRAAEEFRAISGCPSDFSIPIQPTSCSHWDRECFGDNELMRPSVSSSTILSRITLGSLQDLGWEIDLSTADPLSESDFSSECMCSATTTTLYFQKPIELSSEAFEEAQRLGLEYLDRVAAGNLAALDEDDTETVFVGDKVVVVFIVEDGVLHDVVVRR